jgi:predicted restriction endonuclease
MVSSRSTGADVLGHKGLCANCHVKFDRGAIGVEDDFTLINAEGKLRQVKGHKIPPEYLAHHRKRFRLSSN